MKNTLPKILKPSILIASVLLSIFTSVFTTEVAKAADIKTDATPFISDTVLTKVKQHQNYYWLRSCFENVDIDKTTMSELTNWEFFKGKGSGQDLVIGGIYGYDGDARWKCDNGPNVQRAFGYLGYNDPLQTFCSLPKSSFGKDGGEGQQGDTTICLAGADQASDNNYWDNWYSTGHDLRPKFEQMIKGSLPNVASAPALASIDAAMPPEMKYVRYFQSFMNECKIKLVGDVVTDASKLDYTDSLKYLVPIVDSSGNLGYQIGIRSPDRNEVQIVALVGDDGSGSTHYDNGGWFTRITCGEAAQGARDNAAGYAAYVKTHQQDPAAETNTATNADSAPVCSAGALGWVICPAINFIGEMNDAIYGVVQSMLYINPLTVETGGPLYNTWTKFRDLANILFVVVFLMVVFSQATSVGLSSYGVKRILPRILAAAVLVNISFFICQIALDLSNITGAGISGLVDTMRSGSELDINVLSWSTAITAAIGGGAVIAGVGAVLAAGSVTAALAMMLPFMVTALFAIVTAIAVLIARQVIIILLVALAPLAFIAIILPNTQKYFQLWQNTFTTMLVMFPLIALLFSGSQLAANIVLTTSTTGDGISFFALIAAICMMFIPLFGVPYIVKFSGGTIGRIAGMVNNPNKGPSDALRKKSEGYRDFKSDQARGRNLDPAVGAKGVFASYNRQRARRDDRYARAKDKSGRANQRYLSGMYSGENTAFNESAVDVSAAGGNPDKERAIRARAKQEAQTLAGERFARQQLGGRSAAHYSGSDLQAELNRARAGAISQENEESRKRSGAIQQLFAQREQGLDLDQTLAMYEEAYQKAAADGDHETAGAALRNVYTKGGAGRSKFATMIETHQIKGVEAQKQLEEVIYSVANDNRADVVKGGMDNSTGTWSLAGAGGMTYEQVAKLDDKAMYHHLATISKEQADNILGDENLKSKIQTAAARAMLESRAGVRPPISPSDPLDPTNPSSKTWHESFKE